MYPAAAGESSELGCARADPAAQIQAVGAEGQGPFQGHSQELEFRGPLDRVVRHLHLAAAGVAEVLGEDEKLGVLACHFHLVAACPADEDVRRQLGPLARHVDGVPRAEGRGLVGE